MGESPGRVERSKEADEDRVSSPDPGADGGGPPKTAAVTGSGIGGSGGSDGPEGSGAARRSGVAEPGRGSGAVAEGAGNTPEAARERQASAGSPAARAAGAAEKASTEQAAEQATAGRTGRERSGPTAAGADDTAATAGPGARPAGEAADGGDPDDAGPDATADRGASGDPDARPGGAAARPAGADTAAPGDRPADPRTATGAAGIGGGAGSGAVRPRGEAGGAEAVGSPAERSGSHALGSGGAARAERTARPAESARDGANVAGTGAETPAPHGPGGPSAAAPDRAATAGTPAAEDRQGGQEERGTPAAEPTAPAGSADAARSGRREGAADADPAVGRESADEVAPGGDHEGAGARTGGAPAAASDADPAERGDVAGPGEGEAGERSPDGDQPTATVHLRLPRTDTPTTTLRAPAGDAPTTALRRPVDSPTRALRARGPRTPDKPSAQGGPAADGPDASSGRAGATGTPDPRITPPAAAGPGGATRSSAAASPAAAGKSGSSRATGASTPAGASPAGGPSAAGASSPAGGPTGARGASAAAGSAGEADATTRLPVSPGGAAAAAPGAQASTSGPAATAASRPAATAPSWATGPGSAAAGGTAGAGAAGEAEATTRLRSAAPGASGTAAAQPLSARAAGQVATAPPPDTPESTAEAMDVLAALSRRPMTPFRRFLKRVYIWGVFFLVVAAVLAGAQLLRPLPKPALKLATASSYTFAGAAPGLAWPSDGQATIEVEGLGSLGHSGSDDPVPIASVTKVMTAYLILRDHPLALGQQGPTLTVDAQAASDYTTGTASGESVVRVTAGERISEYQALQMLLIPSANNVARLLGRWDAGSDAAFVRKMQAEAAALGMTKTTYTDPSGLTNTTRSTASDQLRLAGLVMQNPVFRQIVSTPSFTPPNDGLMYNNNADLGKNGVIGVKTGSSTSALGCLMFAAQQQVGGSTRTVLGVVLGQPATSTHTILENALSASLQLVAGTEGALRSHVLVKKGDVVGYVDDGLGGRTPLVATADVSVAGWSGLTVQVSLLPSAGAVPHTGSAGQIVGKLVVGSGSGRTETPVALGSPLAEPSIGARLLRLG